MKQRIENLLATCALVSGILSLAIGFTTQRWSLVLCSMALLLYTLWIHSDTPKGGRHP